MNEKVWSGNDLRMKHDAEKFKSKRDDDDDDIEFPSNKSYI